MRSNRFFCFGYLHSKHNTVKINSKLTQKEGAFVESAFNMRCRVVKNTLLHIVFYAILPAGMFLYILSVLCKCSFIFQTDCLNLFSRCLSSIQSSSKQHRTQWKAIKITEIKVKTVSSSLHAYVKIISNFILVLFVVWLLKKNLNHTPFFIKDSNVFSEVISVLRYND